MFVFGCLGVISDGGLGDIFVVFLMVNEGCVFEVEVRMVDVFFNNFLLVVFCVMVEVMEEVIVNVMVVVDMFVGVDGFCVLEFLEE